MRISFQNVSKSYGDLLVVDDLSLEIAAGELFFLLGPSGCGKTTLLRCLAGFLIPESGRIFIGDRDVTNLPPSRRDTGMVFQSYALWPHLTVWENVAFGLEVRKLPKAEKEGLVEEALAIVRMTDLGRQKPNQLSGGQQQRVALARALVVQPTCLLLDEPLSNLDAKLRLEMRREIRRICKKAGLTAVYVTHDQKEALSIADRLAVLQGGRIQQCGPPDKVYRRPENRFVAQFLGETNFFDGQIAASDGDGRAKIQTPQGVIFSEALPDSAIAVGQPVTVSIRPETIRLGEPPTGTLNVFDGAIQETLYLGELAEHEISLGNSKTPFLRVFEISPRFVARDGEAIAVKVWFAPDDVVLLTS
jgi:iron(III) transport system ATP-binding protein